MQFDEVLRTWQEFFEREGIRYAVIGGVGFAAWGFDVREVRLQFVTEVAVAESNGLAGLPRPFDVDLVRSPVPDTVVRVVAGVNMNVPSLETVVAWEVAVNGKTWLPGVLHALMPFDLVSFTTSMRAIDDPAVTTLWAPPLDWELWNDAVTHLNGLPRIDARAEPFVL